MFRLIGLLGGLSGAMDLGSGAPLDESLKRCVVAARPAHAAAVRRAADSPPRAGAVLAALSLALTSYAGGLVPVVALRLVLGVGMGSIILGFVAREAGIPTAFAIAALIALVGATWSLVLSRRAEREPISSTGAEAV